MAGLRTNNRRNSQQEADGGNSTIRNISENVAEKLSKECNNKEELTTGDTLDTSKGVIALISPHHPVGGSERYIVHCFPYEELNHTWNSQAKVYFWNARAGGALASKPVYKHPYTGSFIDVDGYDNAQKYNTLMMRKVGLKKIGSSFGPSQLHGAEEMIYTLKPVHRSDFLNRYKITEEDIQEFSPRAEDRIPVAVQRVRANEPDEDNDNEEVAGQSTKLFYWVVGGATVVTAGILAGAMG